MSEYVIISTLPIYDLSTKQTSSIRQIWFVDLPDSIFEGYVNEGTSIVGHDEEIAGELRDYMSEQPY